MNSRRIARQSPRTVPGTGGAAPDETSAHGQQALRLHAGIAAIAVVLSAFVTWIFIRLDRLPLAVVFAVLAVFSLIALVWAVQRKRRAARRRQDRPDLA